MLSKFSGLTVICPVNLFETGPQSFREADPTASLQPDHPAKVPRSLSEDRETVRARLSLVPRAQRADKSPLFPSVREPTLLPKVGHKCDCEEILITE